MNLSDVEFTKADNYLRGVVYDQLGQGGNSRFQIIKVPAGETVKPHYHKRRTEIFILLAGQGQIYIEGKQAASELHDTALCQPGQNHIVVNKGRDDLLIGVFAIDYQVSDSVPTEEQ